MRKIYRKLFLSLIIVGLLSISCLRIEALTGTKTTFDNKNNTISAFYNVFNDYNDTYLINGPFICLLSNNRIKCTGSSSASSISKLEYEIIGSDSYLASKESYWLNDNKDNNTAYTVNTQLNEELKSSLRSSRASVYIKDNVTYSGSGTKIDPFTFNEPKTNAEDINLVAFYIDTDGDGEYEDEVEVEGKKGFVKFVPTEENYNLDTNKTKCLDTDGIEHEVRYTDSDKTISIVNATKQISCTIGLTKVSNSSKWENICFANGVLKSSRLNCRILADNRKCTNELGVCPDNTNADPYLNTNSGGVEFNKISSNTNGKGLYYTAGTSWNKSSDVDADGENDEVYYFRGNVTNNYVKFAGTLWQIIRIDEFGNIKLIKETSNLTSKWNVESNATYKMRMSYMYSTSGNPYTPVNNSTIKLKLDEVYQKNFTGSSNQEWANYIADVGYCNDKSVDSSPNTNTLNNRFYGVSYNSRLSNPTYRCNNEIDNYTTPSSLVGNKANNYIYPIGTITVDEAIFAGATTSLNTEFYLYRSNNYWTMSPFSYSSSCKAYVSKYVVAADNCTCEWSNEVWKECPGENDYKQQHTDVAGACEKPCRGVKTRGNQYTPKFYYYSLKNYISSETIANDLYVYPVISLKANSIVSINSSVNPGTKTNPYIVGSENKTWND